MRAAIRLKYGPPEVLSIKEVAMPTPKDDEVLIKVYATTVNRTDCGILMAKPFIMRFFTGLFKPKSPITGTDFAGKIEAVGINVSKFKAGDKVWGFNDTGVGTHAEYISISENSPLLIIPENITYQQAAASPEGAHYAYNMITKMKIKAGDAILVNGATGAIGSASVQLLKYFGATVTAVCNTKNIELVKSLGADKVIDYLVEDFTKGTQKYHYVIDAVGKSTFAKCKPLLYPGGIYMSTDLGPGAQNIYLPLLTRFSSKRTIFPIPTDIKRSLLLIKTLLETSQFKPVIDRTYPLEKIAEAYNYVISGQKTGNVLLTFEASS
ncbi:MAG: NAD(P)-dependent alcohol dehydrogenase [Chitinophagaceae bacterium]